MRWRAARRAGPDPAARGGGKPGRGQISGPRGRWFPGRSAAVALITALSVGVLVTVTPAAGAAGDIATGFARAVRQLVSGSQTGRPFAGTPAVGALFTWSAGKLGRHFCTGSVVGSPQGDLVVTAAHCVSGLQDSSMAFVPGYNRGTAPYGVWTVTKVYTDHTWASSADPDDDVAFLQVSQPGSIVPIQDVTGAEQLRTGTGARQLVDVDRLPGGRR